MCHKTGYTWLGLADHIPFSGGNIRPDGHDPHAQGTQKGSSNGTLRQRVARLVRDVVSGLVMC